jgi:hypothetical protein
MTAANDTGGGSLAPVIVTQAHRLNEAVMGLCLSVAAELGIALCVTMSSGEGAQKLESGVLAGAPKINVPPSDLKVIAQGQLSAEGVKDADAIAPLLAAVLDQLQNGCSLQQHYDFGPRTLMQLCTQIGHDLKKASVEKDVVVSVLERCLTPKMVKADIAVFKKAVQENFGVETKSTILTPSEAPEGRWVRVAENIRSITKIEPDCMVLPVTADDEAAFYEEFCKMLNRHGSAMVKLDKKLDTLTKEQLLGSMPKRSASGTFEAVTDGLLVEVLRKAMDDYTDPTQQVWITIETGNISNAMWECLHELLNDSGCLNLVTGEQIRLNPNLRFLFVMPSAGNTPPDTFSRSAVVHTDPPM